MEDERIKSAFEIAMEKVAKMSELTLEEATELKEKECKPRGIALANKFLESTLREADLEIELGKYQGKEGEIVRQALLSAISQSIELRDMEKSRRAIEGMQRLGENVPLDEIKGNIEGIFREFDQQIRQKYSGFEELEKERLQALGISGSAVRANLEAKEEWQQQLTEIQKEYNLRLDSLKEKLLSLVES